MIIAATGLIGSGKDTVADHLETHYGFKRESFASALKDVAAAIMGWDRDLLEGKTKEARAWREEVDTWWAKRLSIPNLTPRWVLQQWGTQLFRQHFHDDIWIASLECKLLQGQSDVVISDCRFPNEVKAIHNHNGMIVRVIRGDEPNWFSTAKQACSGDQLAIQYLKDNNIHESEWALANLNPDITITNNGTLPELFSKVDELVKISNRGQDLLVANLIV